MGQPKAECLPLLLSNISNTSVHVYNFQTAFTTAPARIPRREFFRLNGFAKPPGRPLMRVAPLQDSLAVAPGHDPRRPAPDSSSLEDSEHRFPKKFRAASSRPPSQPCHEVSVGTLPQDQRTATPHSPSQIAQERAAALAPALPESPHQRTPLQRSGGQENLGAKSPDPMHCCESPPVRSTPPPAPYATRRLRPPPASRPRPPPEPRPRSRRHPRPRPRRPTPAMPHSPSQIRARRTATTTPCAVALGHDRGGLWGLMGAYLGTPHPENGGIEGESAEGRNSPISPLLKRKPP